MTYRFTFLTVRVSERRADSERLRPVRPSAPQHIPQAGTVIRIGITTPQRSFNEGGHKR